MSRQKRLPAAGTEISNAASRYDLHDQIGYQLRVANQIAVELFSKIYDPALGRNQITTAQFAVLSTVWEQGGISHTELAKYVSMDMPTLNGVLKRLEQKGMILTKVSGVDKRRRDVFLSAEGRRIAAYLRASGESVSERILAPLCQADRIRLSQVLTAFIAAHRPE